MKLVWIWPGLFLSFLSWMSVGLLQAQVPTRIPARRMVRITVVGGMVLPTRENGQCWDVGCFGKKEKLHKVSEFLREVKEIIHWRTVLARDAFKFASAGTYLPDPYVVVKINGTLILKTKKSPNTLLPMWGESATVLLSPKDTLEVYVYDWDRFTADDPMGFYASVGIPNKYLDNGGIMKLKFGRVHELQLMFKPIDDESVTHHHGQQTAVRQEPPPLRKANPEPSVLPPTTRPTTRSALSPIVVRRPPSESNPPRTSESQNVLVRRPDIIPSPRSSVLLKPPMQRSHRGIPSQPLSPATAALNQQLAGSYRVDKTKMLKIAKFLQENLHRLPPARRATAQLNIDIARGLQMILRLGADYTVHFSTVHRIKQTTIHRNYRGYWSWYIAGKVLTLHVMEQPSSGTGRKKRNNLTVSCLYQVPKVICSNMFGRNHRHIFIPDAGVETPLLPQ